MLVRPAGDANIGAVCRGMKTMGFSSLALVLPGRRRIDDETVRTWSLHAYDLFASAHRCTGLTEALADCHFSLGFTRRGGARRKGAPIDVETILPRLIERVEEHGERCAAVFGNETSGLSREELEACSRAVSIDTDEAFPSLNLSHAVQLVCYLLRRELGCRGCTGVSSGDTGLVRARSDEHAGQIIEALGEIGFFTLGDSDYLRRFFRDLIERADLSPNEADYLGKLFQKIRNLKLHRDSPPGP